MSTFMIAVSTVAVMLVYAIPGVLLVKSKLITPDRISAFAVLLVYVCAPFQTIDALQRIDYSPSMTGYLALTMALSFFLMGGMMAIMFMILKKKQMSVKYRICTIACSLGNMGFMGIPLLEALMPQYPQAVPFATGFFISMNILMWSVSSAIIMHDRTYIKVRKMILNPSTIAFLIAMALYLGRIKFTGQFSDMIILLSKMCTPLCMFILGMRLGAVPFKPIFTDRLQYMTVALKLIAFPLVALAITSLLPVERDYVRTVYIICSVPVANVVLSFSEMLGEGQDTAANVVLLSTLLSIVTIPVMMLLVH